MIKLENFNELRNDELMEVNGGLADGVSALIIAACFVIGFFWGKKKPKEA